MTYKQANYMIDDITWSYGGKSITKDDIIECREICHKALEKQIPKKVIPFKRMAHDFQNDFCKHSGCYCEHIKTFNHEYQYTDYKCPCCDKRVSDGTPKYCDSCGQALDWSETE